MRPVPRKPVLKEPREAFLLPLRAEQVRGPLEMQEGTVVAPYHVAQLAQSPVGASEVGLQAQSL